MPWQLLYTSAPRLLTAGQTGFGTVARHQAVPPLVASAVERASQFARLPGMDAERVVFCHRIVDAAGARHHVLSRIASAGADYTGRTNHLAHHVILTAAEAAQLAAQGVNAAEVLLRFPWRSSWTEAPRWLEENETPDLAALPVDKQEHLSVWTETTGNPLHANHLVGGPGARGSVLIVPPKVDVRRLYAESLRAVPEQGWHYTFTTELDPGDEAGDFRWLGFSAGSPLAKTFQPGRRPVLDLTRPGSLPVPEPLPEKARPAPALNRSAPPKVAAPAGGAFVEPPVKLPPPQIALEGAPVPVGETVSQRRQRHARDEGRGRRLAVVVVLIFLAAAVGVRLVTSQMQRGLHRLKEAVHEAQSTTPPDTGTKPPPPVPALAEAPPPSVPAPVPAAPVVAPAPAPSPVAATVIPLRVAQAAKLSAVPLPELRVGQTHLLIMPSGEERGPLNEARNNLWVSLVDKTPALKLDYAAKRAEWSAAVDGVITLPVQWRILQDNHEVLRVLIGDGANTRPLNAAPLAATQDDAGVFGGDFAGLVRRLGDHSLWMRLPDGIASLLRECGYPAPPIVPLRDLRADTSDVVSWIVKEQTKVKSALDTPFAEPPMTSTAPPDTGFAGKSAAPVSDQVNRLGNRAAPTSSVAGNAAADHERRRIAAEQRMVKLSALRGHPVLQAKFAAITCPFLAGPPGSAPADAVWVCDVVFAAR